MTKRRDLLPHVRPEGDEGADLEILNHIEERVERLVADGWSPEDARAEATRRFGDAGAVRAELDRIGADAPRSRGKGMRDELLQDLGFGLRQMRKRPGFTALAALTLGIGIGAASAIFGVVKAVVLDPLPYPDPERIVVVTELAPDGRSFTTSQPNFVDFRARTRAFTALGGLNGESVSLLGDGAPQRLSSARVTADYFDVFGTEPLLGRTFTWEEGGPRPAWLAVLSHGLWQQRFGGDPGVIGHRIDLDGHLTEVIGVMPPGFEPHAGIDLWLPLRLAGEDRSNHYIQMVARLADGVTLADARADVLRVAADLGEAFPESNGGWSAEIYPFKEVTVGTETMSAGRVLLGAVGLLLLLACGSVSNLLLARAHERGREMGLRTALGAGRARLVRQLLTESLLLALLGTGIGLLVGWLTIPLLQALSPSDTPRIGEAALDGGVLLGSVAAAVFTGLLFGAAPALHVLRGDAREGLHAGSRAGASNGESLRGGLVVAQVAVAVTLLVGVGLLGASFLRLQGEDTGFAVEEVVVAPVTLPWVRFDAQERDAFLTQAAARVESLSGVRAAGWVNILPFSTGNTVIDLRVEGQPADRDRAPFARWRSVRGRYFEAAGIPLRVGRHLEPTDFEAGAEQVVVVSRSLALRLFGSEGAAIGRRVAMGWNGDNWRRVVGVVDDVEDVALSTERAPLFYYPEEGYWEAMTLLVRPEPGRAVSASAVRDALWSVDSDVAVPSVTGLDELLGATHAEPRFNLVIMAVFGLVALVLALMGVSGITLHGISRRTREIGVRMALGAEPQRVVRLILARGVRLAVTGLVLGIVLALALSEFVAALLFRTEPVDPLTFAAVAMVVGGAVLLATWLPARRATRIRPVEVLATE